MGSGFSRTFLRELAQRPQRLFSREALDVFRRRLAGFAALIDVNRVNLEIVTGRAKQLGPARGG